MTTGTRSHHIEDGNLAVSLWKAAERRGHLEAFVGREGIVHYPRLAARAAAIAVALVRRGVASGDRVAILLERGPDAAAALFAAYAVGGIAVMVNDRYRARQIEYALAHAGASVLLTTADMLDRQHRDLSTSATVLDVSEIPEAGDFEPIRRVGPDLAQIIYTSGSTGMPKGVVYTHGALQAGIRAVAGYLGLTHEDRVASLLPLSSVYGLNQLLTAVACSASLVVELSPLAQEIVAALAQRKATVLAAVPPLWIQLLASPDLPALHGLRIAQNAGGHLPADIVRRLRTALPSTRLYLQYGMTETFRSTYLPPNEVDRRPDSMGRSIPGAEILLVDDDGHAVEPGVVGEVVHRGPTVAAGYWNDPEATARTFRPNPLRVPGAPDSERVVFTGDLARRDADGFLHFVGRRDRMIKSMGFRVGPDEVTDALHASGEIREAVVDAEPDPSRGERIVAYVVLREDASLTRLERFCRAELPVFAHPSVYVPRATLARLPSGKYDMEAIRRGDAPQAQDSRSQDAEAPAAERPAGRPRVIDPRHRATRAGLHLAGGT
ncbi:MAG: AMP-binding protein [Gemmatimonadales bacterium]